MVLFVIGNGFDINCELKSKYENFFNHRKMNLGEKFSEEYDDIKKKEEKPISLWDVILYHVQYENQENEEKIESKRWNDIEEVITEILVSMYRMLSENRLGSNVSEKKGMTSEKYVNLLISYESENPIPTVIKESLRFIFKQYKIFEKFTEYVGGVTPIDEEGVRKLENIKTELFDNLYKELRIYEAIFCKYLNSEVEGHTEYANNAQNLFDSISNIAEVPVKDRRGSRVISFNYTSECNSINYLKNNVRNIHGELEENNTIFGVDMTRVQDYEALHKFTKTYRILEKTVHLQQLTGEVKTINPKSSKKMTLYGIQKIVFYGHSLGANDYSYFLSIFDAVNLYGSTVELVFCYSNYKDGVKDETLKQVSALINKYATVIESEAKGNNLLHKLLVENRISIREV